MEATLARKKKEERKPARTPHDAEPAHAPAPEPEHTPAAGVPLFLRRVPASSAPAPSLDAAAAPSLDDAAAPALDDAAAPAAALDGVAIAPVDDELEREAESIADAVVSHAPAAVASTSASAPDAAAPAPGPAVDAAPVYKTYKKAPPAEFAAPASTVPAFLRRPPAAAVGEGGLGTVDEELEREPEPSALPGALPAASAAAAPPPADGEVYKTYKTAPGEAYKTYDNPPAAEAPSRASTTPAYLRRVSATPFTSPDSPPRAAAAHPPSPRFSLWLVAEPDALGGAEAEEAVQPFDSRAVLRAAASGAAGAAGGDDTSAAEDAALPLLAEAEAGGGAAAGAAGGSAGGAAGGDAGDRGARIDHFLRVVTGAALAPDDSRTPALPHSRTSSAPGDPLADAVRAVLEALLGADLSGVRVHKQPEDRALAARLDARAFALGGDIWLGPGESDHDLKLMAHEAAHVLQGDHLLRRAPKSRSRPKKEGSKKKKSGDAGGSTPGAGAALADAVSAPAAPATGDAAPVPLLMPEPPEGLSPDDKGRIGEVKEQAGAAAEAQADMPPAEEVTDGTRAAVAEPAAEAAGRAQGELVEGLDQKVKPSPEIEALCQRIYAAIQGKRPPDEDKLVQADPEEMAKQAGGELDTSVKGDTEKVQGGYDEMGQTPAGAPAPAEQPLQTPSETAETPAVHGTAAVPAPVPAESHSLDADVESSARKMDDAGMNSEPAELVQSGPIADARGAHGELSAEAEAGRQKVIAQQNEARSKANADMAALQAKALAALRHGRKDTAGGVGAQQGQMVKQEAVTRENVGLRAEAIFTQAQKDVRDLLQPLPRTAMERWNTEKVILSREFKASLAEVKKWIDDRHRGFGGAIVAGADYLFGLPAWITRAYENAEKTFGNGVCRVIREISVEVNRVVLACEKIVEKANGDIKKLYDELPAELQEWAAGERARFGEKLDGLKAEARKTRDDFNKDLVQRAGQAVQEVREEIHKLRTEAGGLLGRLFAAVDAFLEDPAKFIIEGLLELVGIPPASFWALVNRISQVIEDIADNPMGFANNLLAGISQGFGRFFDNVGKHLVGGFFDWLFSGLGAVGVQIPTDFSFKGIITFALQLMGITWERVRRLLARHIGEKNVALLEKAYELVAALIEKGPEGIFEMIKDKLDPKQIIDQLIQAGIQFLVEALVKNVSARIVLLFNPAGAIVQALEAIYRVLKWVFENAARIFSLVETVVNGMADVVAGNVGGMAKAVEAGLARLIAPVIDFLADYIGLGDLPQKIAEVIKGFQGWIEGILDSVIGFLANKAKDLLKALGIGKSAEDKPPAGAEGDGEIGETVRFSGGGEGHRMWIATSGTNATLMVASTPEAAEAKIAQWNGKVGTLPVKAAGGRQPRKEAKELLGEASSLASATDKDADALAKLIAKHAAPAPGGAAAGKGGKSEVDSKDDAVEARERALAGVMGKLFELFGGGGVEWTDLSEEAKWGEGSAAVVIQAAGDGVRLTVAGEEGVAALNALELGPLAAGVSKSGITAVNSAIGKIRPHLATIKEVVLVKKQLEASLQDDLKKVVKTISGAVAGVGDVLGVKQFAEAGSKQKMAEVKANPAFLYPHSRSKEYTRVYTAEMTRQLQRQQDKLNDMKIDEWAGNVNAYRMVEEDFAALDSAGRQAVLERLRKRAEEAYDRASTAKKGKYTRAINAINAALAVDGVAVPDLARVEIVIARFGDETTPWRKKHFDGIRELYRRAKDGDKRFKDICSALFKFVVLHNPDQIAGAPEDIEDPALPPDGDSEEDWEDYLKRLEPLLGSRRVNSAIGRQWQNRIGNLYDTITTSKKEPMWPVWELNVKLTDIQQRPK